MIRFTYDPDLVEEAVLLAEARMARPEARAFRRERDRIYETADADAREQRFRSLHLLWFMRLGLNRIIEQHVHEQPEIAGGIADARVVRALTRNEEGADLIDRPRPGQTGPAPMLVIRLRPATLASSEAVRDLLRHELLHVADMLDPAFGYQRSLPASDGGPLHDNMIRDRYRVVWDVTIDGRLARSGLPSDRVRETRWCEFAAAFPMLGSRTREIFDEWFDRVQPTHASLMAFAVTRGRDEIRHAETHHDD